MQCFWQLWLTGSNLSNWKQNCSYPTRAHTRYLVQGGAINSKEMSAKRKHQQRRWRVTLQLILDALFYIFDPFCALRIVHWLRMSSAPAHGADCERPAGPTPRGLLIEQGGASASTRWRVLTRNRFGLYIKTSMAWYTGEILLATSVCPHHDVAIDAYTFT